jgi:ATP-dependent RNA helicase DDX49/DBP8
MAGNGNKNRKQLTGDSSEDELTMEDLMRLQEGPPRKRMRLTEEVEAEFDSGSDDEGPGSNAEEEEEEDSDVEDTREVDKDDHTLPPPSNDFGTVSRVSAAPRAQKIPTSQNTKTDKSLASWSDLDITAPLQAALASMSIRTPTEIQGACIPPLLSGEFISIQVCVIF